MPVCKHCGARIDKFSKDICPVCGFKNPLEGVTSDTIEVTSEINSQTDLCGYVAKKKKTYFLLTFILGIFSINFFYISKFKLGIINLIINILIAGLLFSLFYFVIKLNLILSILLPIIIIYIFSISFSLLNLKLSNNKDGYGSYLK